MEFTLAIRGRMRAARRPWPVALAVLGVVLLALALAVRANPGSTLENEVMDWVRGWSAPGLDGFMTDVSAVTDTPPRLGLGLAMVAAVAVTGRTRRAYTLALAGVAAAALGLAADYALGEIVVRGRPIAEPTASSFPSNHTFRTTAFLGFVAFLSFRHGFRPLLRLPLLVVIGATIALVGPSRIYVGAHWPTDVVAGYLVGAIIVLLLARLYGRWERALGAPAPGEASPAQPGPQPIVTPVPPP